ncbi:MAG: hypothetical protein ACKOTF_04990, partial [Opitutaceae bacterium]
MTVRATLDLPADGTAPRLKITATATADGWYSFGYVGAPETPPAEVEELWQPLIYNERRFPHESFLEAAYRCLEEGLVREAAFVVDKRLPEFLDHGRRRLGGAHLSQPVPARR